MTSLIKRLWYGATICYVIKFWCILLAATAGSSFAQELVPCCVKATGSCRSLCEEISIVKYAASQIDRQEFTNNLTRYCPIALNEFWQCMNDTLEGVYSGSSWWGRACCSLPRMPACKLACATSANSSNLLQACRRSDEHAFFECVDRREDAQDCCSNTKSITCHEACWEVFHVTGDLQTQKRKVKSACEPHSPELIKCLNRHTKTYNATQAERYLPCCRESSKESCREACERVLVTKRTTQEITDGLQDGGCGLPRPHDPMWQCFLRMDKKSEQETDVAVVNRLGIDSTKLHCCQKASSSYCNKLCYNTYTTDWVLNWKRFDGECLKQSHEYQLSRCIEEVDEPCELGCDGLSYCTNFNGRSSELFRSCDVGADVGAHNHVVEWQRQGLITLAGMQLPIHNTSQCPLNIWKAIACTLHVKPCAGASQSSRVCVTSCERVVSRCVPHSAHSTAHALCSLLGDSDDDDCVSLEQYMQADENELYTAPQNQVSMPCKTNPCNASQVCEINRNCRMGEQNCATYKCVPGCNMGEASQHAVPVGTYVRVPMSTTLRSCHKICECTSRGHIENCQPMPCFAYDNCSMLNKRALHGSVFYMECNLCVCAGGERTCSARPCGAARPLTRLPCNCPTVYMPVCAKGRTFPSLCLARCNGFTDADITFGACSRVGTCAGAVCERGKACFPRATACLSRLQTPCLQHICVNLTDCAQQEHDPVCDVFGRTYQNPCQLLMSGRELAYRGACIRGCKQAGEVCGINGQTYQSECEAWANFASVDYEGPCRAVGHISDKMAEKCQHEGITCQPLNRHNCLGFTPPGACCPRCGGAMRVLYSKKQIDRVVYRMSGNSVRILNLDRVLTSLQRHVKILECVVRGHLTIENEIFVSVESLLKNPSDVQLRSCVLESERLASLINRQSARLLSELTLSPLIHAIELHTTPSSSAFKSSERGYKLITIVTILWVVKTLC